MARRKTKRLGKPAAKRKSRRWSQRVTQTSDALTLENKLFKKDSPHAIALSLKRSAE